MPEEQNRILIDAITDLFFITEPSGYKHLKEEGKKETQLHFVGNTMIDTLVKYENHIEASNILETLKVQDYLLVTFHRPANVDDENNLTTIVQLLQQLSAYSKIVFPAHPRTLKNLEKYQLLDSLKQNGQIVFCEPLGYFDFIKLAKYAKCVITDSGGVQEETTFLQVPCITVRTTTERPVTIEVGTNTLTDLNVEVISEWVSDIFNGKYKKGEIPDKWDGKATERLVDIIAQYFNR